MRRLVPALVLLGLLACLSGCGRIEALATVGTRPASVSSAPGCRTTPEVARGWHYRAQLDYGERPPSSSQSGTKSAIRRTTRTAEVESSLELGDVLMVVLVLLLCALGIVGLVVGTHAAKKNAKGALAASGVGAALGMLCLLFGYLSGSVVSIDNATPSPVEVTVDGTTVELPPSSFTSVRVTGSSVDIHTESNGQLMEEVELELDDHIGQTLFRTLFGDGRYIYTVCGENRFSMGQYTYR